jgi:hypothetical protein
MKRFASLLCAALVSLTAAQVARADVGSLCYGGYQPWWNIFAKRNHHMTAEEKRLQRFWHDYYDALRRYYQALDHMDWVAYYKNHGYQINGGCASTTPYNTGCSNGQCGQYNGQCSQYGGTQPIQFAPVFVSPQMQWASPNGCPGGPAAGPAIPGPGMGAIPGLEGTSGMGSMYGTGSMNGYGQ